MIRVGVEGGLTDLHLVHGRRRQNLVRGGPPAAGDRLRGAAAADHCPRFGPRGEERETDGPDRSNRTVRAPGPGAGEGRDRVRLRRGRRGHRGGGRQVDRDRLRGGVRRRRRSRERRRRGRGESGRGAAGGPGTGSGKARRGAAATGRRASLLRREWRTRTR